MPGNHHTSPLLVDIDAFQLIWPGALLNLYMLGISRICHSRGHICPWDFYLPPWWAFLTPSGS